MQCRALARRSPRAYISTLPSDGTSPCQRSEVHPPQVAGMFYPAEPDALNALIADVRKRARKWGGRAESRHRAARRRLVYSGAVAATAFGPWARRGKAAEADRDRRPCAPLGFRGSRDPSRSSWGGPR